MRNLVLTGALVLATMAPAMALEFDEARFGRDARNVLKLAEVAATMRDQMKAFAAQNGAATSITGEQHMLADKAIVSYTRIARLLDGLRGRWDDAIPERTTQADDGDARIRGSALCVAADAVQLENGATLLECFEGTIWEARLNQNANFKGRWDVACLYKDVAERLATKGFERRARSAADFLEARAGRVVELSKTDETLAGLIHVALEAKPLMGEHGRNVLSVAALKVSNRIGSLVSRLGRTTSAALGALSRHVDGEPYDKHTLGHVKAGEKMGDPEHPMSEMGKIEDQVLPELYATAQPGDLMLWKPAAGFWDTAIPGYFIHTALWLGTYDQMTDLGLFDLARNKISARQANEFRDKIEPGRFMLEADFTKVRVASLEYSVEGYNGVLILRMKNKAGMSPEQKRTLESSIINRGVFHLGQDYDFAFDLDNSDTIVCSELAYMSYPPEVKWPVARRLFNNNAISPDMVSFMAGPLPEQPLEVVYFRYADKVWKGEDAWRGLWSTLKAAKDTDFPKEEKGDDLDWLRDIIARVQP